MECDTLGRGAAVYVWSRRGGVAGIAMEKARRGSFSIAWRNRVRGRGPRLHGVAAYDRAMARGRGGARHFWNCGSELVLGAAKCCWKLRGIVTISRLVRSTMLTSR